MPEEQVLPLVLPENVKRVTLGVNGCGFLVAGIWTPFVIGSDGKTYIREKGEITVAPDDY